jgi:hypothetical protein
MHARTGTFSLANIPLGFSSLACQPAPFCGFHNTTRLSCRLVLQRATYLRVGYLSPPTGTRYHCLWRGSARCWVHQLRQRLPRCAHLCACNAHALQARTRTCRAAATTGALPPVSLRTHAVAGWWRLGRTWHGSFW